MRGLFTQFDIIRIVSILAVVWRRSPTILVIVDSFRQYSRISLFIGYMKEIAKVESNINELVILSTLYFIILIINRFGLLPYTYPTTSQISVTLFIGLTSWWTFILLGLIFNLVGVVSHLLPNRTPIILIRFIRLVERVRIIIRPITLRVRLAANITAGHLILTLISSNTILVANYSGQTLLFMLEVIVAIIQRYVFIILLYLYLIDRLK